MIRVILTPHALEELSSAAEYYSKSSPRTADEFASQVEHALRLIAENPYLGRPTLRGARKFTIDRFPYNLIYRIDPEQILLRRSPTIGATRATGSSG